jgi:hypothetical protein
MDAPINNSVSQKNRRLESPNKKIENEHNSFEDQPIKVKHNV